MNPLEALIQTLAQQAGPRGFTFAGRSMQPGESLQQALGRSPLGELEQGGIAMQAPQLLRTLMLASISPPWLLRRLTEAKARPGGFGNAPTFIPEAVAESVSRKPLDPIFALQRELDYQLGMVSPYTFRPLTEADRAAMVMHTLLENRAHANLPRRLLPAKLQELKRWAHGVLQQAAREEASASFPPTPLPSMPGRPINPQTTELEGTGKELFDQLLELLKVRK